jgi:hypothetical protein
MQNRHLIALERRKLRDIEKMYLIFDKEMLSIMHALAKFIQYLVGGHFVVRTELIQVDIGGHPPIPTGSSCQFLVQHILLYFFVIMGSTLLGMFESLHIF